MSTPTNWFNRLLTQSNGRPFTAVEAEQIAEYVETLPERLLAAKRLEESQKWLAKQLSDAVAPRAAEWGLPREPLVNDFTHTLSVVAHAMLLDDRTVLDETVVAPFRGLAHALDVPAEELGELFQTAWQLLSKRLEPKYAAMLQPFFAWTADSLRTGESQSLVETPAPAEVS